MKEIECYKLASIIVKYKLVHARARVLTHTHIHAHVRAPTQTHTHSYWDHGYIFHLVFFILIKKKTLPPLKLLYKDMLYTDQYLSAGLVLIRQ